MRLTTTLQGEYVAPEAVEAACTPSKFVSQIFVYGNSLETNTVAIVVPDKDTIMPWAKSKGINGSLQVLQNLHFGVAPLSRWRSTLDAYPDTTCGAGRVQQCAGQGHDPRGHEAARDTGRRKGIRRLSSF